jgi:hypothetical protein
VGVALAAFVVDAPAMIVVGAGVFVFQKMVP